MLPGPLTPAELSRLPEMREYTLEQLQGPITTIVILWAAVILLAVIVVRTWVRRRARGRPRGGTEERTFSVPQGSFRLEMPRLGGFPRRARRRPPTDAVSAYLATLDDLAAHDPPRARRESESPHAHAARVELADLGAPPGRLRPCALRRPTPDRCGAAARAGPVAAHPRSASRERPRLRSDEDRPRPGAERSRRRAVAPGRRPRLRAGTRWLDLEEARRSLVAADPGRAHNSRLFRQPVTTLDAHLASGLRVDALADLLEADAEEPMDASVLDFGPPILQPPTFRDFYAFERHVGTMWKRRDMEIPEAWYRLPIFYFSNVSEIRGPGEPVHAPRGSDGARLRAGGRGADRHAGPRPRRVTRRRGDRRLHDPQRLERPGSPAGGDDRPAGAREGQGLRLLDRPLAGHARRAGGCPARQGLRSGDDRLRERHRALARHLVVRALLLRRDGRARLRRRAAATRRPPRARAPSAPAVCSRSGTRRSGATWSPATP